VSEAQLTSLSTTRPSPPHNSFLYIALSSGVVPLVLWMAFWVQALRKSRADSGRLAERPFRIPFLLYTFGVVMLGDRGFISPWAFAALSVAADSNIAPRRVVHSAWRKHAWWWSSHAARPLLQRTGERTATVLHSLPADRIRR
jgi:O-antigen ligase